MFLYTENGTPKTQKGKRRGNNGFNGGTNFSYNEGPARKATPQKYKNTWDKRPRSRGGFSDRPRSDVSIMLAKKETKVSKLKKIEFANRVLQIKQVMMSRVDNKKWGNH